MESGSLQFLCLVPLWVIGPVLLVLLYLASDGGFRYGTRVRQRQEQQAASLVGLVLTGVLGLLALLLALTYSLAVTRAEQRKQAVIAEANALGTAYLRTELLSEPTGSRLRGLLRDYTDTRIVSIADVRNPAALSESISESERILNQLWPTAVEGMKGRPATPIDALVLSSLNGVIDLHTTRLAAGRDRLPALILLLLFGGTTTGMWMVSYDAGLAGRRHPYLIATLAAFCAAMVYVTLDIDRPHEGMVRISLKSLIDTRNAMNQPAPTTSEKPSPAASPL